MNLIAIRAFATLAQTLSYSKAALELGVSKANISQQVKTLESQYKMQLVIRTTRKVAITSQGLLFAKQCQEALELLKISEQELLMDDIEGQINIACIGGIFGEQIIAPIIYDFMDQYPAIHINLDFNSQNVSLVDGKFDLAIRFGALKDSSLIARPLIQFKSQLVAGPNYLAKHKAPTKLKDLNNHQLICGTNNLWHFASKSSGHEVYQPKPHLRCPSGAAMRQAAIAGLGICQLPSIYLENSINKGQLKVIWPQKQLNQTCNIIYPPSRFRAKKVQLLVNHLLEQIHNYVM